MKSCKDDYTLGYAVAQRIYFLCQERNISINKLAALSYLTQSTVQNLMSNKSKNPKIVTIRKICYGLDISLQEFFDDEIFYNHEIDNIL